MFTPSVRNSRRKLLSVVIAGLLIAATGLPAATGAAAADRIERPNVKVVLDWAYQGPHAPFFVALSKGYFKAEGLNVEVEAGSGSGNACTNVAAGVFQFGLADLATMVRFDARNPDKKLMAVYAYFDETPLSVVTLKSKGITKPADLDGKKITGQPGQAVYAIMPVLLKAAGAEHVKINWLSVSPQLQAPMFVRGEADGMGGFAVTEAPSAVELGVKLEDLNVMKFATFGVDLYGLGIIVSHQFAAANPNTIKAYLRAFNKGVRDTILEPNAGIAALKAREPLLKSELEALRLKIAMDFILTPHVREHGLSAFSSARMQRTIDALAAAEPLPSKPLLAEVYTDRFLPPAADRRVPR
jgi:NitT/TauT family transport system substrate-binding protein